MKKSKAVALAYKAEFKLFSYSTVRLIIAVIIIFVALAAIEIICLGVTTTDVVPRERLMKEYAEKRTKAEEYIDKALGKIPTNGPIDNRPSVIVEQRKLIALYDFYLTTETCQNDYIFVDDFSYMKVSGNWLSPEQKYAEMANNIIFIFGFLFVFLLVLSGIRTGDALFGRKAKTRLCGGLTRKSLIGGKIGFELTLLAVFSALPTVALTVLTILSPVKQAIFYSGTVITSVSLFGLLISRYLFAVVAGLTFYGLALCLRSVIGKTWLAFLAAAVVFALLVALGEILGYSDLFIEEGQAYRAMLAAGLLFNRTGFYDIVSVINLVLTVVCCVLLYYAAAKGFIKMQF